MKVGLELSNHLIHSALRERFEAEKKAFITSDYFCYLVKQRSFGGMGCRRAVEELDKFFSEEKIEFLEKLLKNRIIPRPGVYETQTVEGWGFPEYFVYEKERPEKNFFLKMGSWSDLAEKLKGAFDVRLLNAELPEEIKVDLNFS